MNVTVSAGLRLAPTFIRRVAFAASLLVATFSLLSSSARSQEPAPEDQQLGPIFMLSLGGRLYDDLWPILEIAPPDGRNPALADSSISEHDSWRCVSCHGWDYNGAGVAADVPSVSLVSVRGIDPAIVVDLILAPYHPFPGDQLPELAVYVLAAFLSDGQYDRDALLDENGHARGEAEAGRDIFEGACINCHELDGRAFLRGEKGDRSSLGWIARNRPEQALHKILNGVPVTEMLSLRFLSDQPIADLFAYVQSLDVENR